MMKPFYALIAGLLIANSMVISAQIVPAGWTRLDDCRLNPADYADGDSFHVNQHGKNFHLRLYFVDCPETDTRFPDRVHEQMKAFGLATPEAVVSAGHLAHEFTVKFLGKPFTVLTKWADARGDSAQERFYAILFVGEKNLAEELVRAGFARAFGMFAAYPDEAAGRRFVAKLKRLQTAAARSRLGAYSGSASIPAAKQPLLDTQGTVTDEILKGANSPMEIEIDKP